MKKLLAALFTLSTLCVFSQTPQGINYQSIIRNSGGTVMSSTPVTVEFKLFASLSPTAALLYDETHATTTNSFGMANLIIGQGTVTGGAVSFNNIPWVVGVTYEVYVNSSLVGSRQSFMSVPYALHAASAPAPNVTFSNNILSVGNNTVSITSGSTYTAGNGINISSGVITGSANITGSGATTVNGVYPNLTITTPTTPVYSAGSGIDISGTGVISNTAVAATNPTIVGAGATSVNSSGNTFTITTPAPQVYTAGSDISITSGSVITNAAPDKTVIISGVGATVTSAYPNFTINVPSGTNLPTGYNGQFLYNTGGNVWDTLPRTNLYFDGSNFGIGTTSPSSDFHVNGAGKFNSSVSTPHVFTNTITITGGTTGQVLTSDATGNGFWQSPTTVANYSLTSNSNTLTLSNGSSVTTATVPVQPTVTGGGVVNVTPFSNSYLVNVPMSTYNNTTGVFSTGTQTIAVTPSLTLAGTVLRSGPATNTVSLASLNTWSLSSGVLFPATLTNSVGVGTSGPLTDRMEISHPSSTGSTQLHIKQTGADAFSRIKFSNTIAPGKFWLSTVTSAASDANSGHNFFYNNGSIGHNVFTVAGDGRVSVNTFSTMTNAIMDVNGALEIDSTFVVNSVSSPATSLSNSGKIYFDATTQKFRVSENGGAYVNLVSASTPAPWMQGAGIVTLTNFSDLVGIGTNSPASPLHVANSGGAQVRIGNFNQPTFEWIWDVDASANLNLINEGNGSPISHLFINASSGQIGMGTNTPVAKLDVNGNIRVNDKLFFGAVGGINSGYTGIYSENDDLKLAVFKPGASPTAFGPSSNSLDAVIIKSQTGNVGIGTSAPNSRLDVASAGVPPTITGLNNGSGHGVFGETNSSVSAGVMGINDNSGPSVAGIKVNPATGNVANFKNTNTANNSDALISQNDGGGAAIHTINGPTTVATNNLGLLIEDGHIGTASATNLNVTGNSACGCISSITMESHSTDVAGTLKAVYTATTGAVVDMSVTFVKPYKKFPVVIITPGSHPSFSYTQYIVVPIGAAGNYTGFRLSVESGINSAAAPYFYNYMVIEGKN